MKNWAVRPPYIILPNEALHVESVSMYTPVDHSEVVPAMFLNVASAWHYIICRAQYFSCHVEVSTSTASEYQYDASGWFFSTLLSCDCQRGRPAVFIQLIGRAATW